MNNHQVKRVSLNVMAQRLEFDLDGEQWPDMFLEFDSGTWEASTVGFVVSQCKPGVTFVDIGAASGIFSVIAAAGGASVVAFEPHAGRHRRLVRNANLNSLRVDVRRQIVTNIEADESEKLDRSILSRNVHDSGEFVQAQAIRFSDFLAETSAEQRLVIKCDIEGAEYRLFSDQRAVEQLVEREATVLLSVHPGLNRDVGYDSGLMRIIHGGYKRLMAFFDNRVLFSNLRKFRCRMVNGASVNSAWHFQRLVSAGMRDFIFESLS